MEEDSDGDAVVTAEDSSNMVKPENRDKVRKFWLQNYAKIDFPLVWQMSEDVISISPWQLL